MAQAYGEFVAAVRARRSALTGSTAEELLELSAGLRVAANAGRSENLAQDAEADEFLTGAFAAVVEAAERGAEFSYTDRQLALGAAIVSGGVVHTGQIFDYSEAGPILALCAYTQSLAGLGVHVVLVDTDAATEHAKILGSILGPLGTSVGLLVRGASGAGRAAAVGSDVTCGSYRVFCLDYLRMNCAAKPGEYADRGRHAALVCDINRILVGGADDSVYLAEPETAQTGRYLRMAELAGGLQRQIHYRVDEDAGHVELTAPGEERLAQAWGIRERSDSQLVLLMGALVEALRAKECFTRGVDYTVAAGQVSITADSRALEGTNLAGGRIQAIEAKEGLELSPVEEPRARISVAEYFKLYRVLAGVSAAKIFMPEALSQIYGLRVTDTRDPEARDLDRGRQAYQAEASGLATESAKWRDVTAPYRQQVFALRTAALNDAGFPAVAAGIIDEVVRGVVARAGVAAQADPEALHRELSGLFPLSSNPAELSRLSGERLSDAVAHDARLQYRRRTASVGQDRMRRIERVVTRVVLEQRWGQYMSAEDAAFTAFWPHDFARYRRVVEDLYEQARREWERQIVRYLFRVDVESIELDE